MTRLPTPGGDAGDWGDILNAYLEVSHAADGSLKSNVVDTPQLKNGSVTNAKLDASTQTQVAQGASAYQKPASGIPESDLDSATQTKIDAAGTAYQKPGTGIPKSDLASGVQTSLDLADTSVQTVNGQVGPTVALTKSDVGLGSVDNTSDANKPISTATQTALNAKLTASSNLSDVANAGTARTNLGIGSSATHPVSDFLQTTNNLSDVTASTARTNLGLGGSAILNVGTTSGTVAAGDDSRIVNALSTSTASTTYAPIITAGTAVSASGALAVNVQSYCSAASGNLTMTLPTGQAAGKRIIVTKSESSTNTVTVTGNIQGIAAQAYILSLVGQTVQFETDSSGSWWPISSRYDLSTLDNRYQLAGSAVGSSLAYSSLATGVGGFATNTTFVDIPGTPLTISPVLGTRAVEIQARLTVQPAATTTITVGIFDATASAIISSAATTMSTASGFCTIFASIQVTPGAGTRTYRPQISTTSSTTCNVYGANVNSITSFIAAIQR